MSALKSITLPDGVIKYTLDDWIGYRQPGQPMLKTKWRKTNIEYWEFPNSKNNNVYTVQKDNMNIFKNVIIFISFFLDSIFFLNV